MAKLDMKKELRQLYHATAKEVAQVDVPPLESRSGLAGKHHEIYLADIHRADPKKWKTVIRQPMR